MELLDMKKVCVSFGNGCPRSLQDATLIVKYFRMNGWEITTKFQHADIVVLFGCAFTQKYENETLALLKAVNKKMKKGNKLILSGCISGINPERAVEAFNVIALKRKQFNQLDDIINAKKKINEIPLPNDFSEYQEDLFNSFSAFDKFLVEQDLQSLRTSANKIFHTLKNKGFSSLKNKFKKVVVHGPQEESISYKGEAIYNIRVATGCLDECSYCAIRFYCGSVKSVPLTELLKIFDEGLANGYTLFRLLGEDVGCWGQDIGTDITELLSEMMKRDATFRLIIDDFSPRWLNQYFPVLSELITRNKSKFEYIGIPVQSGSDKILKSMKRLYKANEALECISSIHAKVPELKLGCHILIGFPGEEETDFEDTINFVNAAGLSNIIVYSYSDRPHTKASLLTDKITDKVIQDRMRRAKAAIAKLNQ
ncbi:radical SAM protein [Desulfogranum marinum]|uniref:radical SAM protein n=1 Tax=Desulfogranum marinum TaxID=453220 RepID=UPI0029C8CBC7|nr:radical SAM protein [Desulfogranum marinum]